MGYKWDINGIYLTLAKQNSMKFRWRTNLGWIHSFSQAENRSFIQPKSEGALNRWRNHQQNLRIQKLQMVNQHTWKPTNWVGITPKNVGVLPDFSPTRIYMINIKPSKHVQIFQQPKTNTAPWRPNLLPAAIADLPPHRIPTTPLGCFFHSGKRCFLSKWKNLSSCLFSNCASSNFGA